MPLADYTKQQLATYAATRGLDVSGSTKEEIAEKIEALPRTEEDFYREKVLAALAEGCARRGIPEEEAPKVVATLEEAQEKPIRLMTLGELKRASRASHAVLDAAAEGHAVARQPAGLAEFLEG